MKIKLEDFLNILRIKNMFILIKNTNMSFNNMQVNYPDLAHNYGALYIKDILIDSDFYSIKITLEDNTDGIGD